jgi:hypothetical protein
VSDSILEVFRADSWTLGNCSVQVYDRRKKDVYGDHYLRHLYDECLRSRPSSPFGILPESLCGFSDLTADSVCSYLAGRPALLLLCIHTSTAEFTPVGFAYPTMICGAPLSVKDGERSMFAGFIFFKSAWGTPELEVLGMLGLAYLFSQFRLLAVHGQRTISNRLAARYMARFGARDMGTIPYYMLQDGKLVSCTVSTLLRTDFESYTRKQLLSLAGEGILNERQRQHTGDQPSNADSAHHG